MKTENDKILSCAPQKEKTADNAAFQIPEMKQKNTLGAKIAEARKECGLNQHQMVAALGQYGYTITDAAFCQWEKGSTCPGGLQLLALCDILNIRDPVAYFTDKTRAQSADPDLNQAGLDLLRNIRKSLMESGQFLPDALPRSEIKEMKKRNVKIFLNRTSAGPGNWLDSTDNYEERAFNASDVPDDTDFGIQITGDSMEPEFKNGDIVFVKSCSFLHPGEIGVFDLDGNSYTKQYQETWPAADEADMYTFDGVVHPKILLVSLNKKYSPIEVRSGSFKIFGRVLGSTQDETEVIEHEEV